MRREKRISNIEQGISNNEGKKDVLVPVPCFAKASQGPRLLSIFCAKPCKYLRTMEFASIIQLKKDCKH